MSQQHRPVAIAGECSADRAGPCARRVRLRSAIVLALYGATAGAASANDPAPGAAIEEMLVTATRRATAVQDIPYNISAFSGSALEESRINEVNDLARFVPGISFIDTGPSNRGRNNTLSIRGVTADDTSDNAGFPVATVAPVSTYIGETPLFLPLQLRDIERVEVLRGPQGTLYGSGSLAGTVRFIPRAPDPTAFSFDLTGDVASIASGSSDHNYGVSGAINFPINEQMAVRISGAYQHWGGFINLNNLVQFDDPSTAAPGSPIGIPTASDPDDINSGFVLLPVKKDANDADIWHIRTAFLWDVTERFTVEASHFRQQDEVSNIQAEFRDFQGGVTDILPADENPFSPNEAGPIDYPTGGTVFRASNKFDLPKLLEEPSERTTDLFALNMEYDLGFANLASSTSYYNDKQDAVFDLSSGIAQAFSGYYGFMPRLVDIDFGRNTQKGWVQELRLVSNWDRQWDFVIGGFFQNVKTDDSRLQYIPGQTFYDSISVGFHANPQLGDINFQTRDRSDFEDYAVFGEVTWNISDRWQVTAGMRAFWQDFSIDSFSTLPYCGIFCGDNELGDTQVNASDSVTEQIYKLNTSYFFTDDLMGYLTYAEGFRRGGANGLPLAGPFAASPDLLLYGPDQTENYEIGLKGRFLEQNFTVAAYYIDWNDVQINGRAAAGGYRLVANGTKARSRGIELELGGNITDGLRYSFGYSFIDAEIADSFEIEDLRFGTFVPIISTQSGDDLPNVARHSYSVVLDYTHAAPMLPGWDMRWHVDGSYRGSVESSLVSLVPGAEQPRTIDSFSIWNASINLTNNRNWDTSLYIDNMFNSLASTGGVDSERVGERGKYFYVGRPRTFGLRVSYAFQ